MNGALSAFHQLNDNIQKTPIGLHENYMPKIYTLQIISINNPHTHMHVYVYLSVCVRREVGSRKKHTIITMST